MKRSALFLFAFVLMCAPLSAEEICTPPHAVILIYHHISDDTPASTSVSPEIFEQHLNFLADNGFRVMDLPSVVEKLKAGEDLPDSVVVLTFDDGYDSVYTEAFPRLKKRGWPFTVFVCPEVINKRRGSVVTWDQLRDMSAAGATIASHGLRHDFMNRPRPGEKSSAHLERLKLELLFAKKYLVDQKLNTADMVAYPYGEYSPGVQSEIEKLGWTAFGQQSGAIGPNSDFTCLARFPMAGNFASLETFGDKVSSLPMPTSMVSRMDPNLDTDASSRTAPTLTLMIEPGCLESEIPVAFASGQGSIPCNWLDRDTGILQIKAPNPLPQGRSRYNVTAAVPGTGRFYWFSQVWIVGQEHQY